jgi:hypothetical protein
MRDAEHYRQMAKDCRGHAERATNDLDRQAWLRLADDWEKLALGQKINDAPGNRSEHLASSPPFAGGW